MKKKRILFLGETYRADAITWMNGLKDFGNFELVTWELKSKSEGISRLRRIAELFTIFFTFRRLSKKFEADMVIAERTTSYGLLAAISGIKPMAIAQQGITDLWPENSPLYPLKKAFQKYAFRKANLIHAWGPIMAEHMQKSNVNMGKVMVLPKGINLNAFTFKANDNEAKISAIVTRSLLPEYKHEVIIRAFSILKQKKIDFSLTIVGDGPLLNHLRLLITALNLDNEVVFTGRISNHDLPQLLQESNIYVSMPTTEGVSASLFEAMASGCFPIVTDLPGNRSWIKSMENGTLVPSENIEKLASEIEWAYNAIEIRQKAILVNRKFVEENANYAVNMRKIAAAYHQLIIVNNENK
jgi:glycosyltransferase involved in cell wall biosynthesis